MLAFVPQPENSVCEHYHYIIIILINNHPFTVIESFHSFLFSGPQL